MYVYIHIDFMMKENIANSKSNIGISKLGMAWKTVNLYLTDLTNTNFQ